MAPDPNDPKNPAPPPRDPNEVITHTDPIPEGESIEEDEYFGVEEDDEEYNDFSDEEDDD